MNEAEFAFRIRQALDEGALRIDPGTAARLAAARRRALEHAHSRAARVAWTRAAVPVPAATVGRADLAGSWWNRWLEGFARFAPIALLVVGFVAVHQWNSERALAETAALDFAVLLDEFPIDTYAEKGFTTLLKGHEEI